MNGELIAVWSELRREVWLPLSELESAPDDLFSELYREVAKPPVAPIPPTPAADAYNEAGELFRSEDLNAEESYKLALKDFDEKRAAYDEAIAGTGSADAVDSMLRVTVTTEPAALAALERIAGAIEALEIEPLQNGYFRLIDQFISKYSLRYDLRRPFSLHPTLPGIFVSLMRDLRAISLQDAHLFSLFNEFEESVRDLRTDSSSGRIKTCLQKQFNLAEALGQKCPGVTAQTLGDISGQLTDWPHVTLRDALKKLYGFRSDYPGLGHGGSPKGVLREIEMKDLVAVSVLLAGFFPYLCHELNSEVVYAGV